MRIFILSNFISKSNGFVIELNSFQIQNIVKMEHAIEQGISLKFPESCNQERPDLFWLVSHGHMTDIYTALESIQPIDIDLFISEQDRDGRTPIFYATFLDLPTIAVYLLSQNCEFDKKDYDGQNIFHGLAFKGNYDSMLQVLHYQHYKLRAALFNELKAHRSEHRIAGQSITSTQTAWELKSRKTQFHLDVENLL